MFSMHIFHHSSGRFQELHDRYTTRYGPMTISPSEEMSDVVKRLGDRLKEFFPLDCYHIKSLHPALSLLMRWHALATAFSGEALVIERDQMYGLLYGPERLPRKKIWQKHEFVPFEEAREYLAGLIAVLKGDVTKSEGRKIFKGGTPPFYAIGPVTNLEVSHPGHPSSRGAEITGLNIPAGDIRFFVPVRDNIIGRHFNVYNRENTLVQTIGPYLAAPPYFDNYCYSENEAVWFKSNNMGSWEREGKQFVEGVREVLSAYMRYRCEQPFQVKAALFSWQVRGPARRLGFEITNPHPEAEESRKKVTFEIPLMNLDSCHKYNLTAEALPGESGSLPCLRISVKRVRGEIEKKYEFSFENGSFVLMPTEVPLRWEKKAASISAEVVGFLPSDLDELENYLVFG